MKHHRIAVPAAVIHANLRHRIPRPLNLPYDVGDVLEPVIGEIPLGSLLIPIDMRVRHHMAVPTPQIQQLASACGELAG